MKKIIFLLIINFPFFCSGQMKVNGKIKDDSEPVPFANVVLFDINNKMVGGSISDSIGGFELFIPTGSYKLVVSYIGFENYEKDLIVESDQTLGDVLLTKKNTLSVVEVVGHKKMITQKIDRMVVNVEDSPIMSGGNAVDALKASPGLVFKNDELGMIGKSGMKVMINDRLILLSGPDLITFLNSISANDIKEIEIITNPPARYEAEGNSGIVNIKLKKIKNNSWNNTTSFSYMQARYARFALNNAFSYQKDKVGILFSLNSNRGNFYANEITNMYFTDAHYRNDLVVDQKFNDYATRFSFDYDINSKTKIGVQYLGSLDFPHANIRTNTTIRNNSDIVDSTLNSQSSRKPRMDYHSLNTHFENKIDTLGKTVSIDLDFLDYKTINDNSVITSSYLPNGQFSAVNFMVNTHSNQRITNYNTKIDFTWPVKFANLSYGGKVSFINSKADVKNYNTITGVPVLNELQSNQFVYTENIQALYFNGSKKLNEKWETQIGLRGEFAQTKGIVITSDQVNKNQYFKLFPTFYISYNRNDSNAFVLSYGRRIQRPKYAQLNPSRFYVSSNSNFVGNPFLQPTYANNIEFTHTYKHNLSTKLFFNIQSNASSMISYLDDATNEQFTSFANFYTNYSCGFSESFYTNLTSWWKTQNSIEFYYSQSKKTNKAIDVAIRNGFEAYLNSKNYITLNKSGSIMGEVDFWYDSPFNDNIYHYSQNFNVDLAIKFKSLINNLEATAGIYDVFYSSPKTITSVVNGIKQDFIGYHSNRYFRVSLTYNFGNKDISSRERESGNEDEKRRSK